jgi:site-specific DNA-adenine methylase
MVKRKWWGVPYKGSKSQIVDRLVEAIPYKGVDSFYDLFAGGCAVTHKMLLEGRYRHCYANDIDGRALRLFRDGMDGKYALETRWVSREDFFKLKDTDPYISCCWSFGNNQRDYLYSKAIEPYKKACHYAIMYGDFSLLSGLYPGVSEVCKEALREVTGRHGRRIKFRSAIRECLKSCSNGSFASLYTSCDSDRLESLERLQSLESLERLQSFQSYEVDYREVGIRPNSVIYADIPYFSTNSYSKQSSVVQPFNHSEFYDWCCKQKELVLISEYYMPADRFTEVWNVKHKQSLSATKTSSVIERLFVPTNQLDKYHSMTRQSGQTDLFRGL